MWTKSHLTLSALTWTKSCITFLFNSLWFRYKHNETRLRQLLFLLLYLNLQDDNGMFRNSLNCFTASLTETALLLGLLRKKIHITCIVVFYISLKLTNCEYCSKHDPAKRYCKTSSNWRSVIQQLSISYAPIRLEHRPPVCHPPSPSTAWTTDWPIYPRE